MTNKPYNSSSLPTWQSDFLAFYPILLEHLKQIKAIKKVCEAKELEDLDVGRVQVPLDGAVYVVIDSIRPSESNNRGREQMMTIGMSVILAKQQYNPTPKMDGVGATLTAICKALQGYEPMTDGKHLTHSPFVQDGGMNILYRKGFALYPLHFSVSVAIVPD